MRATRGRRPAGTRLGPVRRLRTQAGLALLLTAALLIVSWASFAQSRAALHRLTAVSVPRATVAADLYVQLADLDAQHANALVYGYDLPPQPATAARQPQLVDDGVLAALTAQADQRTLAADLATLADLAGPEAVGGLNIALDRYDEYNGIQDYARDSATTAPLAGSPEPHALTAYSEADALLRHDLLPQVRTLLDRADAEVAQDRDAAHSAAVRALVLLLLAGVLTLAQLLWWQRDLAVRYQRVLNPALVPATAAVLAFVLAGSLALSGAADEVRAAVGQGYAPYARIAQARVAAADAEAVQSRWVVDPDYRELLAPQFTAATAQVGTLVRDDAAVQQVTLRLDAYEASDRTLRQIARSGDLVAASQQLTGVSRGQTAFAYYDLALTLQRLATEHASAFTAHADAAGEDLSGWTVLPAAVLLPTLVLVGLGVRPRLAEFD